MVPRLNSHLTRSGPEIIEATEADAAGSPAGRWAFGSKRGTLTRVPSPANLMWSLVFGVFGMAYFVYGKRQRAPIPFLVGIALMLFPYFIANLDLLVAIGAALVVAPYFVRLD